MSYSFQEGVGMHVNGQTNQLVGVKKKKKIQQ